MNRDIVITEDHDESQHYPILLMPIDQLHADPQNPRVIDDGAMQRLIGSMDAHGFTEPVVWNKRTSHIVGGHARVEAARIRGYKELPTVVVDIDDAQEATLNIALNAPYGEFDDPKLTAILRELDDMGIDLDDTGLPPWMIDDLMKEVDDLIEDVMVKPREEVECPACGWSFDPSDAKKKEVV